MRTFCALLAGVLTVSTANPAPAGGIELIARGQLPATETDGSGLRDDLAPGLPHARLGGFSALEFSGAGNTYFALSDRGPLDGAVPYRCRFHVLEINLPETVAQDSPATLTVSLTETHLLSAEDGQPLTGLAAALDGHRFDPEGLRVTQDGRLFVSDEYGPAVLEFAPSGNATRTLPVPERYRISNPSASKEQEAERNTTGRQPNRGFEGLAIAPDEQHLWAILQGPLIQDSREASGGKRKGVNVRVLELSVDGSSTREWLYQLDDDSLGVSEILAVDDRRLLVLERDGKPGAEANCKQIVLATLDDRTTDISRMEQLPSGRELPADLQPLRKSVLIDLLDPAYGLAGDQLPEKFEGLTFGPTLADGRRTLLVCVDNDFVADQPTWIYAFAIPAELLSR